MLIYRQDLLEKFDQSFALEEGQHFYAPRQTQWMLPITEAEANWAVARFRVLSALAMAATWLLLLGALAFFFYRTIAGTFVSWDMLIITFMAIAPSFLHALAFSMPQKPFVKRLRRLVQENDPVLASLLVRKGADVEAN